jgi:hypothetical protein
VRAAAAAGRLADLLLPAGAGLDGLPAVRLAAAEMRAVAHGGWTGRDDRLGEAGKGLAEGTAVRLLDPRDALVAIARVAPDGRLVTDKVLLPRATDTAPGTRDDA